MSNLFNLLSAMCGKIKKPDLSQNDPEAADYVMGRTHYVGEPIETTLIPEQTVAFEDTGNGFGAANSPVNVDLVEGNTYIVIFDGETYECTCQLFGGVCPIIGSPQGFGAEDTGEPFMYVVNNGRYGWYAYDTETEHTLSLSTIVRPVVQIPEKYLPIAGDDTYGLVKRSEVIRGYTFPILANAAEMNKAIDAFRNGVAMILWNGALILIAERVSDTEIIVRMPHDDVAKRYTAHESGSRMVYSNTLGEAVE
jgi:hypothetical protein